MKKILIDFFIALGVTAVGVVLCLLFRAATSVEDNTPKTTKLETVDEITEFSNAQENSEFENWVIKMFDFSRPNLSLLEHNTGDNKDKADLLVQMDTDNESIYYMIAVECIWRKEITNRGLYWAPEGTLKKYMNSADEDDAKLFLVFGLGGSPSSPKSVHIVPVKFLQQRFLSLADLANYECGTTHGHLDYEVPAHKLVIK